jgi:hypothetical protein
MIEASSSWVARIGVVEMLATTVGLGNLKFGEQARGIGRLACGVVARARPMAPRSRV